MLSLSVPGNPTIMHDGSTCYNTSATQIGGFNYHPHLSIDQRGKFYQYFNKMRSASWPQPLSHTVQWVMRPLRNPSPEQQCLNELHENPSPPSPLYNTYIMQ